MDLKSEINECYELCESEKEAINEGIAQLNQGMFLSNEEAKKQADQCLKSRVILDKSIRVK